MTFKLEDYYDGPYVTVLSITDQVYVAFRYGRNSNQINLWRWISSKPSGIITEGGFDNLITINE